MDLPTGCSSWVGRVWERRNLLLCESSTDWRTLPVLPQHLSWILEEIVFSGTEYFFLFFLLWSRCFQFFIFFLLPYCHAVWCPLLNGLQRCHQLGWWAQLCPAVGTSCVQHKAAPGLFSQKPPLQPPIAKTLPLIPYIPTYCVFCHFFLKPVCADKMVYVMHAHVGPSSD